MTGSFRALLAAFLVASGAHAASAAKAPERLPPQARYVALGSSFAAGPGITKAADTPPNRCARSMDNYPRQLARKRNLLLVDVSCNAATTNVLLQPGGALPAQVDALTPDTRLVTVTIGGNDVSYMGGLISASCRYLAAKAPDPSATSRCNASFDATEQQWAELERRMDALVAEVRKRAPAARLIFVDYLSTLPERGACDALPLPPETADKSRAVAHRLAELTARVARRGGADDLQASRLSRSHNVCSKEPWVTAYGPLQLSGEHMFVPYHPNLAGMTAIADALDRMLER